MNEPRFLYVLERYAMPFIKIGIANDPHKRANTLSNQGGFQIRRLETFGPFYNASEIEARVHAAFAECRQVGEWFDADFCTAVQAVFDFASRMGQASPPDNTPPAPETQKYERKSALSEHELVVLTSLAKALSLLPDTKLERLAGFAEGVNAMASAQPDKPDDTPPWD